MLEKNSAASAATENRRMNPVFRISALLALIKRARKERAFRARSAAGSLAYSVLAWRGWPHRQVFWGRKAPKRRGETQPLPSPALKRKAASARSAQTDTQTRTGN